MKLRNLLLLFIFSIVATGCTNDDPSTNQEKTKELTISAAASLQDVLTEIKPIFEEENSDIELLFNFGGSGALQQQILQGAPVDAFLSAAMDKFSHLANKGYTSPNAIELAGNSLVLIVPKDSKLPINHFEDLTQIGTGKLAMGTPESVPAGHYARQSLQYFGIWDKLKESIVYAKDVRQVLTYVETGNVEAGIVYKTDALLSDKVRIVAEASAESHEAIIYPAGVLESSKNKKEAELFLQFLQESQSKGILQKYGFQVLD